MKLYSTIGIINYNVIGLGESYRFILFLEGPDMDEWQTSKMELFPKPDPSIPSADISATTFQINNPIKV